MTGILRSRCRHTKQKDTGAAYFHITTRKGRVDLEALLKEVIALREVNEFHEFCSEKLFKAITNHPDVEDCVVMLLYARRGSLDINPVRASKEYLIPKELIDTGFYTKKAMGQ
jgi:7-cyano-7-deazaguanine reductase